MKKCLCFVRNWEIFLKSHISKFLNRWSYFPLFGVEKAKMFHIQITLKFQNYMLAFFSPSYFKLLWFASFKLGQNVLPSGAGGKEEP